LQQASFDNYAREYDGHFTNSLIGKSQRAIVHKYLRKLSDKQLSVLEINCGTGEDALLLCELFKDVACTDVSEQMINVCNEKVKNINNCKALVCNIKDLEANISFKSDLVFSNFGGLNCLSENELRSFASACIKLTGLKSELLFVIMGRKCFWERMYFRFKGNKEKADRRVTRSGVETKINGAVFQTYYYSPKEIENIFAGAFEIVKHKPVGFFIPPSYLNPFFQKHKFIYSILCNLEKVAGAFGFLSDRADHYLIHLKRR